MAADLKATLTARYKEVERLWKSGDYQTLAKENYTEDCKLVYGDIQTGRDKLVEMCKEYEKEGTVVHKSEILDVSASPDGEMAYCVVRLESRKRDGTDAPPYTNLIIWKKVGGVYRVHLEK
ncbi:uncharacterized protein LOC100366821 [Saccoglossus kowalevskii]|uniref:Uncharacterized protein LOC100366821 n=1 Tax=Saccoglossus kowalevskii TaxID=10224 RepID=A0ABM0MIF0_SACKO|nr:PREDICTED: uncharacterized protein LOC100366821 [Saccoglossus kowalevskii]